MVFARRPHLTTNHGKDTQVEIVLGHPGVDRLLRVVVLLPDNHGGALGVGLHFHVDIGDPVIYRPFERVQGRAHRHPNPEDHVAAFLPEPLELDSRRHVEQVGVVHHVYDVALERDNRLRAYAGGAAVVEDAEKNGASLPVGKRAQRLEDVLLDLAPTPLELEVDPFSCFEVLRKLPSHRTSLSILAIYSGHYNILAKINGQVKGLVPASWPSCSLS